MKMRASSSALALLFGLMISASFTGHCNAALQVGYYKGKCKLPVTDVELIVRRVVTARFVKDRTIAAALLRMHFHDCFVNGCDASILLDGSKSEKTAPPNLSVRGYDVIDDAKAAVEMECPGIVSCADIIAMAARDSVLLSGGGKYDVQTGRRDGFESLAKNVDLPAPSISVPQSIAAFAKKGLNYKDMVYLLGGHTIGVTHCALFKNRLYNFQNTGKPDPTMNVTLANQLRLKCSPQSTTDSRSVNLDQNILSSSIVDNSYFLQIQKLRGILQIDQEIALDTLTKPVVDIIAKDFLGFSYNFGQAMVKMGATEVLTGTQGEIRKSCRVVNKA